MLRGEVKRVHQVASAGGSGGDGTSGSGGSVSGGDAPGGLAPPPGEAEFSATRRTRLGEINEALAAVGKDASPVVVDAANQLRTEKDQLQKEELLAKPCRRAYPAAEQQYQEGAAHAAEAL